MKSSKILSLLLAVLLIASLFTGCSTKTTTESPAPSTQPDTDTSSAPSASPEDSGIKFPLAEAASFSMWTPMYDSNRSIYTSLSDHPAVQLLEERTNITIEFVHATAGSEQEDFNLMMSSQDYEDVIATSNSQQSATTLLENSVIYDLTDYLAKYMPNYNQLIQSDPNILRDSKDDNGKNLYMYAVYDQVPLSWGGYAIRKDLLDKAGLEIPETYADWEAAGLAFKEMDIATPVYVPQTGSFTMWNNFESGFGIGARYYRDGKSVKYGPMEPGYKEYVTLMKSWYEKGILNAEFFGAPGFGNGLALPDFPELYGGTVGACAVFSSHLAKQIPESGLSPNADMYYTAVASAVRNKGEKVNYSKTPGSGRLSGGNAITTAVSAEMLPIIMSFFDYLYSGEGSILANYGVEGKSFEYDANGTPHYTDIISSSGFNGKDLFHVFDYALFSFPELDIDKERIQNRPEEIIRQQEIWIDPSDATISVLPALSLTADEAAKASSITNDANTFVGEMTVKFIIGTESLDKYDTMIDTLKTMGIEEAIAINQAAFDRYNSR